MWRSCGRCISWWCQLCVSEVSTAPGEELRDNPMLEHLLPAKTISETQLPFAQNNSYTKFAYFGWHILFLYKAFFFLWTESHIAEAGLELTIWLRLTLNLKTLGPSFPTPSINYRQIPSYWLYELLGTELGIQCIFLPDKYSELSFHWSFQSCFFQSRSEKSYTSSRSGSIALSSANLRQLFLHLFPGTSYRVL